MELLSNLLLFAAALGAGFYCLILSRRLKRFSGLETGMGGAIAVLSAQVDDLARVLGQARTAAQDSAARLEERTQRAESAARQLELMLAALHDLPPEADPSAGARARFVRRRMSPQDGEMG
ncbi:hypothetical protein [Defluviimonas sp. WL0075]|uniref:Chemotaxis protein n=1 Tax=Albidovulum sediminicola TaxID=2984331 RepID=A0ABT2YWC8_9RHOB|nr:hypothetical protein [Defluviimonas sp. WL0075]MCV2863135.1 hypothetical protein [Defluviimonas sp. WL0075]